MPGADKPVPEAVIDWVRWLNNGVLFGFPEDGLTLGTLAALTRAISDTRKIASETMQEDWFLIDECLRELARVDPQMALDCVVMAIAQCDDYEDLAYLAAGPLEDLIADEGPVVIENFETWARQQPRFRYALSAVWPRGQDEDAEVWQRVLRARAAGPNLDLTDQVPDWEWG